MRKVAVFNNVTLDGYFSGIGGDISWAHKGREDTRAFANGNVLLCYALMT